MIQSWALFAYLADQNADIVFDCIDQTHAPSRRGLICASSVLLDATENHKTMSIESSSSSAANIMSPTPELASHVAISDGLNHSYERWKSVFVPDSVLTSSLVRPMFAIQAPSSSSKGYENRRSRTCLLLYVYLVPGKFAVQTFPLPLLCQSLLLFMADEFMQAMVELYQTMAQMCGHLGPYIKSMRHILPYSESINYLHEDDAVYLPERSYTWRPSKYGQHVTADHMWNVY
nr:hypothetical protein CFP56_01368 [Quercus suber]